MAETARVVIKANSQRSAVLTEDDITRAINEKREAATRASGERRDSSLPLSTGVRERGGGNSAENLRIKGGQQEANEPPREKTTFGNN